MRCRVAFSGFVRDLVEIVMWFRFKELYAFGGLISSGDDSRSHCDIVAVLTFKVYSCLLKCSPMVKLSALIALGCVQWTKYFDQ